MGERAAFPVKRYQPEAVPVAFFAPEFLSVEAASVPLKVGKRRFDEAGLTRTGASGQEIDALHAARDELTAERPGAAGLAAFRFSSSFFTITRCLRSMSFFLNVIFNPPIYDPTKEKIRSTNIEVRNNFK